MFIKPTEFERLVNHPVSRQTSYRYLDYENVESIHISYLVESELYKVSAVINVLDNLHNILLYVSEEGEVVKYHCQCRWCDSHRACAHIGVVLLLLNEENPTEFPYTYVNHKERQRQQMLKQLEENRKKRFLMQRLDTSKAMIDRFKQTYEQEMDAIIQQGKYEIIPMFGQNEYQNIVLSFKVGKEKKYIIKNVRQFLEMLKNETFHRYGKMLALTHREDAFDEMAKMQIALMKELLQEENYSYYYYNTKELTVSDEYLDLFFDTYFEKEPIGANFVLEKKEYRIPITIKEEDDFYVVALKESRNFTFSRNYFYEIEESFLWKIRRIILDERGQACKFMEQLQSGEIVVGKEQYEDFYKYVIADIMEYLEVDMQFFPKLEHFDLISLYGDIDDEGQMQITLEYSNEEKQKRYGFSEDKKQNTFTQDLVERYIEQYVSVIDREKHIAYLSEDQEVLYAFISEGLTFLEQYCDIYVSDALRNAGSAKSYQIQIGVRLESNLLEVDINSDVIPKDELASVLQSYRKKRKFHKLKNGELLLLESEDLKELDAFMEDHHLSTTKMENGVFMMNSYRMFSLEDMEEKSNYLNFHTDESLAQMRQRFTQVKNEVSLPSHFESILRTYQKEGFQWLHLLKEYGFNGILADDMGLGKTLQVIALLESIQMKNKTSIVVCPSSLIYNWEEEVHKFSNVLNCLCVTGSLKERKLRIAKGKEYDLLITSYDYMRKDVELYETYEFEYIILDEAQYIKNQKTRNAISVKQLKGNHKLALTGTPIENSLAELWSVFDFLMPDYLFNYHYFKSHYEQEIVKFKNEDRIQRLQRLVSPFILRRNKKEVLEELPDKIEHTITIDFEEEERKLYYAHLAQVNEDLQKMAHMEKMDNIAILAMMTKLRQICCDSRLLFENIHHVSSKMQTCMELIHSFKENNQKVLLFSSFTSVLDLLAEELQKQKISYYLLTGKTSKEERRNLVNAFQNDTTSVFLISLKAGGTGLNLTAAEAVIHFDPWWNLSAQNQATDRAYRIGQHNNVQVYKLIMKDSIEEKIQKLQVQKKDLADYFVEHREGSLTNMSSEEIMDLFTME